MESGSKCSGKVDDGVLGRISAEISGGGGGLGQAAATTHERRRLRMGLEEGEEGGAVGEGGGAGRGSEIESDSVDVECKVFECGGATVQGGEHAVGISSGGGSIGVEGSAAGGGGSAGVEGGVAWSVMDEDEEEDKVSLFEVELDDDFWIDITDPGQYPFDDRETHTQEI
ncbi:hypothetical protein V2J09_011174 [Rumex salicifolius]